MMNLNKLPSLLLIMIIFASCNGEKITQSTCDELIGILSASVESERERFEWHVYKVEDNFSDPTRFRFASILDFIKLVNFKGVEFDNLKKQLLLTIDYEKGISTKRKMEVLDSLQSFILNRDEFLMSRFESVLIENQDNFDYRDDELEVYLTEAKKEFDLRTQKILNIDTEIKDDDIFQLKLLMIEEIALNRQWFFGSYFLNIVKTSCGWDAYFPVIQPKIACINKGGDFEAHFYIGKYSTGLNPQHTKIIVNGDTLAMDKYGVAPYKIKAKTRGEVKLDIECQVLNPLTGVIIMGASEYIYTVN